ncbi:hypothetical protein Ndes2437B_g07657 [Nannochloris sp. 'desiccata']
MRRHPHLLHLTNPKKSHNEPSCLRFSLYSQPRRLSRRWCCCWQRCWHDGDGCRSGRAGCQGCCPPAH